VELINHFKGTQLISRPERHHIPHYDAYPDMQEVKGQETARRALEIAAAGGHNMLMVGPPGSGKSMLASRLPGLIPPLSSEEMLEVSMINSISGNMSEGGLMTHRPFRDPHHNCSMAAMIGGGAKAKPGEITLSHGGILFLDELPEFPGQVLDSLRQPLENKRVSISRVQAHVTYPANFQLVAAMNPCRCGYLDDASRACSKAPKCAKDYQSKLSGPLLDRIDLHVEVPAIRPSDIYKKQNSEKSADIRQRVAHVRNIQTERYKKQPYHVNALADGDVLLEHAKPDTKGRALLEQSIDQLGLTMRGHNRVLRVARTIADMEGATEVAHHHIAEALSYRQINYNN
jgi:magnesium chelatase family protein